jgi:H+/Cl- antiporter ClcA
MATTLLRGLRTRLQRTFRLTFRWPAFRWLDQQVVLLRALWRHEMLTGGAWMDRAIILAFAGGTGVLAVGFTLLAEYAGHLHAAALSATPLGLWLGLIWTPALAVGVLWWARRFAPGAQGSGIQQVLRALDDDLTPEKKTWLVSIKLSFHKVIMVCGGLLAGLSIGREGPMVQIGAGVMNHARRYLRPSSAIDSHDLLVAGAAAGIAAAFNTPLGGVIFALEKMSKRRSLSQSTVVISSIVLAGLVSVAVFGNLTYFGELRVQELSTSLLLPGLLVAVASGLAGGLFSKLLIASTRGLPDRFCRWRAEHPFRFAAACTGLVALIGIVTHGATSGAGYEPTRDLLEGQAQLPGVYTVLKFCATWLSAWSGVPGGIFAPSLSIGAGIGRDIALLADLSREAAIPLIALGMVGFLAAVTQGPLTAFIIVMEMVAGHSMVLSLMACAMLASGISRLISPPLYQELASLLFPAPATAPPPAGNVPPQAPLPQPQEAAAPRGTASKAD